MERFTKSGEINILLTESFLEECMYCVTSIDSHDTFIVYWKEKYSRMQRVQDTMYRIWKRMGPIWIWPKRMFLFAEEVPVLFSFLSISYFTGMACISLLFKADYPIFAVRIDVSATRIRYLLAKSDRRLDLVNRKACNFSHKWFGL